MTRILESIYKVVPD